MATEILELSVVKFTLCISDTDEFPVTYTLIKKGFKIEPLLNTIDAVADTYKSSIKTKVNEAHCQDYVIPIKTGILEKDIEIYFYEQYGSDHTILL